LGLNNPRKFSIGACDWSLGKTSDIKALEVAKTFGLDGVQVSPGTLGGTKIYLLNLLVYFIILM
jgi:hypothetical protein